MRSIPESGEIGKTIYRLFKKLTICGAYGEEGTFEKHKEDLLLARDILKQKFPNLKIVPLYLKLNGEFVKV